MNRNSLYSISPLDGRYSEQVKELSQYVSEFAFLKYRVEIELIYLRELSQAGVIRKFSLQEVSLVNDISKKFTIEDAKEIKDTEDRVKHDVKAIEYFLRDKLTQTSLKDITRFIHFGITSEDVNNLAYGRMWKDLNDNQLIVELKVIIEKLSQIALVNKDSVMVARTHGQPAVPTTFGKEIAVYSNRLKKILRSLEVLKFEGKINGAVGNYNALVFAYPKVDWIKFSKTFIKKLGLIPNLTTTQIIPGDIAVRYFQLLQLLNNILIGMVQDLWWYISLDYLKLRKNDQEVGSSTMPQKVNPIDFENAEGNLELAIGILETFIRKFPKSRLQRDLSDSTVKRSVGAAFGYTLVAWKSIERGLGKISFNTEFALDELEVHYEVLAEAIQIHLKKQGDEEGFEKVKSLMRGQSINKKEFNNIIKNIPALAEWKIDPKDYIGMAGKLVEAEKVI